MFDQRWKKVTDQKSKQENNERGQEDDEEEEAKRLKTDDWAAFKQPYVSSGSPKTQKEMLGSSPWGLLKKHPGQIVPSSPWLLVLFFLSLFLWPSLSLLRGAIYPDYIRGQSLIRTLGVPVLDVATMGCLFSGCYSSGKLRRSAWEPGPGHMKASHLFDEL